MSLAWEEMHCLQCRLSLQPIWILELQSKYLFAVFYLERGSWAASQTPVDTQPFPFSLSQTKAFGYIAACLIHHQSAQIMNMTVDVKYLKYQIFVAALVWFSLVVVHSLLTQGCRGSHWWGISAEIRDLVLCPREMFTLGFHSQHCWEMVKCSSSLWKQSNTVNPQSWFSLEWMQGSRGKSLGCSIGIIFETRVKIEPCSELEQAVQAQCSLHQGLGLLSTSLSLLRWSHPGLCVPGSLSGWAAGLGLLSNTCWSSCEHLALSPFMHPSECPCAIVGDHLWCLQCFSSTLTLLIRTEVGLGGIWGGRCDFTLSFYTSVSPALEILKRHFWKAYIIVHKLSSAD